MFKLFFTFLRSLILPRSTLHLEILALRHQLSVLQRTNKRPRLRSSDRILWAWLFRLLPHWRSCLVIVKPDTVVKWHRQGFKLYWRWLSRAKRTGRPKVPLEVRELIRRMSHDNSTWGVPRIKDELTLLGIHVAESTIRKYRVRGKKPPSQTWRSFLKNHVKDIAAIDFFTVHTIGFRVLYCFIVLRHDRRRIVHINVTTHPTAAWTAQQIINAFPFDDAPKYLIRDHDGIYGNHFHHRLKHMGIEEVVIAPRSPWQNPFVERVIGSIRRDCLDHVIVLNEVHLIRILTEYSNYYHTARPHQSLDHNAPLPRTVEPLGQGQVVADPILGGLHHRYRRAA
ncbi:MAG: transposase [Planctomycetes bacterium]|nr:transposase [Planctomycetota bacterium]